MDGDPALLAKSAASRMVADALIEISSEIKGEIGNAEKLMAELRSLGIDESGHGSQDLTGCCLYVPSAINVGTGHVVYGGVNSAPMPRLYDIGASEAQRVVNPFSAGGSGSFLQLSSRAIQAMRANAAAGAGAAGAGAGGGGSGSGRGGGDDDDKKASGRKAKLRKLKLPQEGLVRFLPEKKWKANMELKKGEKGGYLDRFDNEWVKGPSRTRGEEFEWDIQLSRRGEKKIWSFEPRRKTFEFFIERSNYTLDVVTGI